MQSDDIVLSVKNVSKCFEMYEKPVYRLYQTLCAGKKKFYKEFWALKDISFDVRRGECVGVIGKNGAGKSTLLQIVTGTLAPTTGTVETHGRIAALLELGSGFNPEFTGRENVYLNGSILGLSREEIDRRYDEILAFADIGEFIDQPVNTYSSGMMVRLAFAVQVMVDPDVLIVDEALAVGDAAFQRKCFARMDALQQKGVTILLVTHDTETVKQRCNRAIFLKDHVIAHDGPAEEVVVDYMHYLFPQECEELQNLFRNDIRCRWQVVDALEPLLFPNGTLAKCPICGYEAPKERYETKVTERIFGGGRLERYVCPDCDCIFGPLKMDIVAKVGMAHSPRCAPALRRTQQRLQRFYLCCA